MILVTGASGQIATTVITTLLRQLPSSQIAALVRNPAKASQLQAQGVDLRIGSYDDRDSLDRAMQAIDTVLLISGTEEGKRVQQHQNVIDAAKKAGVKRIAYTSRNLRNPATLANTLMHEHFQTEEAIKASGLSYTIFRNSLYMDAIPQFIGGAHGFERGIILPAGAGRVAFALRSEQGEAMANALVQMSHESQIYALTGAETWSFADVAEYLSELMGQAIAYTPIEGSAFAANLKQRGLDDQVIQRIIGFMTDIKFGQEDQVSASLETLLGRKPSGLKAGLSSIFAEALQASAH